LVSRATAARRLPFLFPRIKTICMRISPSFARTIFPAGILVAASLLLVLAISCGKKSASQGGTGQSGGPVQYTGTFVNASSPDSSKATGSVAASFDPTTLTLTYSISWAALTSMPIEMHFHDNGPVIVVITGFPVAQTGTISGTCKLTAAQAVDLAKGGIYAMIHTVNYGAGEIDAPLVH
jgi:hypothetical protein